jgi:arylformamidase
MKASSSAENVKMIRNEKSTGIDRRLLLAALAAGSAAVPFRALAQQAASAEKGPKVWLDMDQREIDDAYDQSKYAPNFLQVLKRYASNSIVARQRIGQPRCESYGPTAIEKLEIYSPKAANAPIHIHIHGGAWRQRPATEYAFPAELLTRCGAHYLVPDFVSVDETKGDLRPMVDQVRRAIAWTVQNAGRFGGDPSRIYLSGFSSGSHLAGVALTTDWSKDFGLPGDVIKGAVLSSGLYDLKAVRLSARSKYVTITDDIEESFSPQRHLDLIRTPLVLAHGSYETPEFKRQTRDFAAALKNAGKQCEFHINDNYNHFEMMETFGNPYGLLGHAVVEQMRLSV